MTHPVMYVPRSASQKRALAAYESSDIIFLVGPAGAGKTHAAVAPALRDVMAGHRDRKRLILCRPQVEAADPLGFLPGKVNQKMEPWMAAFFDVIRSMTFTKPEEVFAKYVEVIPLAFMRGRTFDRCVAILDEAQNCTAAQLDMFLTRIGEKGKLIISGDPEQPDRGDGYDLEDAADDLEGLKITTPDGSYSAAVVRFSDKDVVRHPLISAILQRRRVRRRD